MMKPGFHLWMLKPKSSHSSGCTHIRQTSWKSLNKCVPAKKLMKTLFWDRKGVLIVEFMQQGTTITSEVYCETLKKTVGPFRTKGVECLYPVYCSSTKTRVHIQLLVLEHCCSVSAGSCLATLLTVLISLRATPTCLPTWRTDCDHNASTIMRSWWKVLKHMWLSSQAADFDTGIQKLILRYDKCLNSCGDYVEK
jgi:hypothetical protein